MLKGITEFFRPPNFTDNEKSYSARIIYYIAIAVYIILLAGIIVTFVTRNLANETATMSSIYLILAAGFFINTIVIYLARRGQIQMANILMIIFNIGIVYYIAFDSGGLHRPAIFINVFVLALSALLFRGRGMLITGIVLAAGIGIIYWLEISYPDLNPNTPAPIINVAIMNIFIIMLTGFLLQFASQNLYNAMELARKNEIAQKNANDELRELQSTLENRVAERTQELEKTSRQIQKRANQIQVIAEIASSISGLKALDELLQETTTIISNRFQFYHVGIFLADEKLEFAILRAANSDGGQKMLARNHKLKIGLEGIVGSAIASGRARIALDVGADAVYFNNPDLPSTRSELALPLKIGENTIGALDVQSEESNAFTDEDMEVLGTLANQISVAIQNSRLYNQTQQALRDLENNLARFTESAWVQQSSRLGLTGYRATDEGLQPITSAYRAKTKRLLDTYTVPLKLRQVTFGRMGVKIGKRDEELTEDQKAIIQAAADRVALALENARLFEDAQRKAATERVIGEVSSKLTAAPEIDSILRLAVEEIGKLLENSEVAIQLNKEI